MSFFTLGMSAAAGRVTASYCFSSLLTVIYLPEALLESSRIQSQWKLETDCVAAESGSEPES